ncbi:MAG: hypothetical protein N0E58_04735 [Candidatus Thiodiazotropha endolucinida]|uniref:Uncharacterized protein n=1 Tax=Candidatus Thiodiazotropha taylori TaxID=2792791 RepID=A0A9E4NHQ8_9GAMM|nr:hypothetical protein [Candidatus Thiodiazotropha taylori]MCW4235556.1 hypothetical protein [Candidatus Thiodiazotropha endolucinida]
MKSDFSSLQVYEIIFTAGWQRLTITIIAIVVLVLSISVFYELPQLEDNERYIIIVNTVWLLHLVALGVSLISLLLSALAIFTASINFEGNPSIEEKLNRSPVFNYIPWLSYKSYQLIIIALVLWLGGLLLKLPLLFLINSIKDIRLC